MGKLIISDSSGAISEFPLNRERITIGRHADNDIALNDKAVSGHHAVVVTILQDSFLEDLDSTNGTQVNAKQISKHPLSHGDLISIGRNSLRYENDAATGSEDFNSTVVLKPTQLGAALGSPVKSTAADTPTTAKPLLGRLRVASGPNEGKELELSKALTTIGKPGVQVAAITRRADGYYIVHVSGQGDTQRPLVNGLEIDAQARRLSPDDIIELAGTKMRFLLAPN